MVLALPVEFDSELAAVVVAVDAAAADAVAAESRERTQFWAQDWTLHRNNLGLGTPVSRSIVTLSTEREQEPLKRLHCFPGTEMAEPVGSMDIDSTGWVSKARQAAG